MESGEENVDEAEEPEKEGGGGGEEQGGGAGKGRGVRGIRTTDASRDPNPDFFHVPIPIIEDFWSSRPESRFFRPNVSLIRIKNDTLVTCKEL